MRHESCQHERSHIIDSRFHGLGYSDPETRRIFCDHCRLQRWLDVEVALALSQADLGLIPRSAAQHIDAAADVRRMDLDAIAEGIQRTGHSLVPLLQALEEVCPEGAGEYIHYGATTQDIQDTAQSLEMRDVLDVVERKLLAVLAALRTLALAHRDTLMIARTHSMPALPTTFGLKAAGWIDELLRHCERLRETRRRVLVVQLFGGVGTMAAFGPGALRLLERFASRLRLAVPSIGWHAARDRVAEFVTTLAMVAASAARVADEVRTLNRPELGEVKIPWSADSVGSSTMPHKRNPEVSEQVVVLARLARMQMSGTLDAMIQEHERDYRGTRLEWCTVANVSHYTTAALSLTCGLLEGLQIERDSMAENVMRIWDVIGTERLVFELSAKLGKSTAYRIVSALCRESQDRGRAIAEAMRSHPEVTAVLGGVGCLEEILNPRQHLGMNSELIDRVIARLDRELAGDDARDWTRPDDAEPVFEVAGTIGYRPDASVTSQAAAEDVP